MEWIAGRIEIESVDAVLERIDSITAETNTAIQAFDSRYIAGAEHIERAVELADRSIERGEAIARDRSIEILCYAAGRRQIEQAFDIGLSTDVDTVVFVLDGGDIETARSAILDFDCFDCDRDVIDVVDPDRIRQYYGITEVERSATTASLETLVCERIALLTIDK